MTTLAELRRLLAEATPGEWETVPEIVGSPAFIRSGARCVATKTPVSDAALIVALRNHADALLDVVEAGQAYRIARGTYIYNEGIGVTGRKLRNHELAAEQAYEVLLAALARLDGKAPLAGAYCTNRDHSFDGTRRDEHGNCPKCEAELARLDEKETS